MLINEILIQFVYILGIVLVFLKFVTVFTKGKCKSNVCLVGKTAIVTGGNSGLGLGTVIDFASRGCKVIIASRSDSTDVVNHVTKITHNANVSWKQLDLASFKSVRAFADDVHNTVDQLDILICNAGSADLTYQKTEDGLQNIMQVNHYGHFLLIHLLLDKLLKSSGRIVYNSSILVYLNHLTINNMHGEDPKKTPFFSAGGYGNSKLAASICIQHIAKELKGTGVTANFCHPGFIPTKIVWRPFSVKIWNGCCVVFIAYILGKTIEEGIEVIRYLAYADEVRETSGKFFIDCLKFPKPPKMRDQTFCEKVWHKSEESAGLMPNDKLKFILERYTENSKVK